MLGDSPLFYVVFIFPGAILLWIVGGFKTNLFKILNSKNKSAKIVIVNILLWGLLVAYVFLKNNGYIE
jgi:hypothetical protein